MNLIPSKQIISTAGLSLLFVGSLVACGETKKLDDTRNATTEMRDTTHEMNNTTHEMNETTRELLEKTESMLAKMDGLQDTTKNGLLPKIDAVGITSGELYDSLRQGDGSALRRAAVDKLKVSSSSQNRLAEAGLFMMSFEFQLMNGIAEDSQKGRREELYRDALMEFMLRLDEFAPKDMAVIPEAMPQNVVDSDENRASVFNAISAALHKVNRKQGPDPILKRPASMFDLLSQALLNKSAIESGRLVLPPGPHAFKEVLARESRVIQLLLTRYNYMILLIYGHLAHLDEKSGLSQLYSLGTGLEINLDASHMGVAALQFLREELIEPNLRTKELLEKIGVKPELTFKTKLAVSRVKLVGTAGVTRSRLANKERDQVLKLYSELVKQ